jgi:hypothetical protein
VAAGEVSQVVVDLAVEAEASEVLEVAVSVAVEPVVVGRKRQRAQGVRTPLSSKRDSIPASWLSLKMSTGHFINAQPSWRGEN